MGRRFAGDYRLRCRDLAGNAHKPGARFASIPSPNSSTMPLDAPDAVSSLVPWAAQSIGACLSENLVLKLAFVFISLVGGVLVCAPAAAQAQELPNSISGRWRFPLDGTTQTFALEEIRSQPDRTFTAKLTWWQTDPWCATRGLPIVGRETESGIAFEVPRKCNISYSVQLRREASGWIGTASNSMRGFGLELDLKAN